MFSITTGSAAELLSALAGDDLSLGRVVSAIEQIEYRQRALDAFRTELLSTAVEMATGSSRSGENELAYRSLRAELATTLGTSERTIESQLGAAWSLQHDYPTTHQVLSAGEISMAHARVIVDAGARIGCGSTPAVVARRATYESEVLQHARKESVNRLRPIARRIAEQYAVETLDERHTEEARKRRVVVQEREDGMSDLWAYLPTVEAYAIHDRLTRIAQEVERVEARGRREAQHGTDAAPEDAERAARRSRDELRADAFVDALLASDPTTVVSCPSSAAVRARVQVIVPVAALDPASANEGHRPVAELVGAGPIDLASARRIAGTTPVWEQVLVDGESGAVIAVDRYRPSEEMKRQLAARDQHCRFPGCRVPISRCDLDHTVDAALGGPTSTSNSAHLCRGHHVLKHHSHWQVRQRSGGDLHWTSPSGREHVDRPPSLVRFARPAPTMIP